MEKHAAKRCQTLELRQTYRRCSPIGHTIGRWISSFPLSRHRMFDHSASDDLLSPPSGLSHRFLARIDMIVLFFLSETSKEYLS